MAPGESADSVDAAGEDDWDQGGERPGMPRDPSGPQDGAGRYSKYGVEDDAIDALVGYG